MFTRTFLTLGLGLTAVTWASGGCRPSDINGPDTQAYAPSPVMQASQGLAHPMRPFQAEVRGEVTFPTRPEGRCRTMDLPFLTGSVGAGVATHMGRVQFTSAHCFESPSGPPPPYGLFERGEMTLVAENGDELHMSYEGEQTTPIFANPTLGTAEMIFTGGTGRFSSASGWAHGEIQVEVPADPADPWPIRLLLEGQISY